jgi:hypothetical protein
MPSDTGPAGTFRQTTESTNPRRDLFAALGIDPPKKIIEATATRPEPQEQPTDAPVA